MSNRKSVPKYSLHKSSGQARVVIDGKHIYLGPHGSPESREKYARLIAERCGSTLPAIPTAGGERYPDILMAELLVAYLKWAETYYLRNGKPGKTVVNIGYALRPLRALYASLPAREFGPKALKVVQQYMVDEEDLCRTLINRRVGTIKRMFQWAVSEELIPPSVFEGVRTVKGLRYGRTHARESDPVKPADDAWVEATLAFLPPQVAAMVRLQRLTGMRPEDVCAMRAVDIDMGGEIWLYEPQEHKNKWRGHKRVIPIGPRGQEILRPFLLDRSVEACLFSPAEAMEWRREQRRKDRSRRKTKIYPCEERRLERERQARKKRRTPGKRPPREYYVTSSYYRAIRHAIERAAKAEVEIPHWTPNQLRHARATEVRKTDGVEAAQVVLGHARADVTQVYAQRNMELAMKVARRTG